MESPQRPQSALFEVYLRLRPPPPAGQLFSSSTKPDRFLTVEEAEVDELPSHITLNPPNDNRRRAVEKFAFTKVFEEHSTQLDILQGTGVLPLVEGVLGPHGGEGRDGLLATLGVTGSGKSHTILGSRTQRGLTQLALDALFRSISTNILDPSMNPSLHATIAAADPSESQVMSASMFLETMYGDASAQTRVVSRAPTPMVVRSSSKDIRPHFSSHDLYPALLGLDTGSPKSIRVVTAEDSSLTQSIVSMASNIPKLPYFMRSITANARKNVTKCQIKGESYTPTPTPRRNGLQRPSALPHLPDISNLAIEADSQAEYAVVISMYEVYNDRIFDLLTPALPGKSTKDFRRRALLFKSTEQSPDRKIVAGLRKIICGTMREALMVLEAGLHERRVAGTGSNSMSSRSHGFFCVEVKKRRKGRMPGKWGGSTLTIVDLAGSERARDAKTQGQTLQEAGKINESLMYLGQCLQMQSDLASSTKPNLVPFRQCKLTELLFSNSFPSYSNSTNQQPHQYQAASSHRNPQKAIMIVTADPLGDFNATSQILRYSALAREVTVPRIPSVTSTILAQSTSSNYFGQRPSGRGSPTETERETMEIAALEIARMSEEIDGLRAELLLEQERRLEVEAHLESARAESDHRVEEKEAEVREECYQNMEQRLQQEMQRWRATWAVEQELGDEHLDRKLDILARGMDAGGEDKENDAAYYIERDLVDENERLRGEVELLTRQLHLRSPSHKSARQVGRAGSPLQELAISHDMDSLRISSSSSVNAQGSPLKKVRKMTERNWDVFDEDDFH